jgi:hypothetical protein
MILQNHQVAEIKPIKCIALWSSSEKRGPQNEGKSHDVIEKNVEKMPVCWSATMLLKKH